MPRLGLALSGGSLRATPYHIGVVRFLRDAGLLRDVTHLVSVSGGSILRAHLALNWEQYIASAAEFEAADSLSRYHLDTAYRGYMMDATSGSSPSSDAGRIGL